MKDNFVLQIVLVLVPMILSLTVHEYAHALAARFLGDKTAEEQGRFTLSPLSHIDPIGTLLLPVMMVASTGGGWFGWAKPVPYNPLRFDKKWPMRTGTVLVAAAGPVSNFVFALLVTIGFGLAFRFNLSVDKAFGALGANLIRINLGLGLFNLLPVPPLDGSKVLWGLLPQKQGDAYMDMMQRAGTFAFIAVVMLGGYILATPIQAGSAFLINVLLPVVSGA